MNPSITLARAASDLRDCAARAAGIAASIARLADGPEKHLPAYQSRCEELAVNFAALRRVENDLMRVRAALRPHVDK